MKTYTYATDAVLGEIQAESLQSAYDKLMEKITPETIADGATLWVESEDGDRITMPGLNHPTGALKITS